MDHCQPEEGRSRPNSGVNIRQLRREPESFRGKSWVRDQYRQIAGSPWLDGDWYWTRCQSPYRIQDLINRCAFSRAKVDRKAVVPILQVRDRLHLGARHIGHTDIVAHACSIGRIVVVSGDGRRFSAPPAQRIQQGQGSQDVSSILFRGIFERFAQMGRRGKVDDRMRLVLTQMFESEKSVSCMSPLTSGPHRAIG